MSEFGEPWTSGMETEGPMWSAEEAIWESIKDSKGQEILTADIDQRELLERVVACVNACTGIPTSILSSLADGWRCMDDFPAGVPVLLLTDSPDYPVGYVLLRSDFRERTGVVDPASLEFQLAIPGGGHCKAIRWRHAMIGADLCVPDQSTSVAFGGVFINHPTTDGVTDDRHDQH